MCSRRFLDHGEAFTSRARAPVTAPKRSCWIWPNDGQRQGMFGGIKDVLTGKGPDMHLGLLDTRDVARSRWSRWPEYDCERFFNDSSLPPARHADRKNQRYNFRKRRYEDKPSPFLNDTRWSDVRWCADREDLFPLEFRDTAGRWHWMHPPYSSNARSRSVIRCYGR